MVSAADPASIDVALGRVRAALLIAAVLDVAPRVRVVAAPPMFKVVAVVLKRFAVVLVVVRLPPLIAKLPDVVASPVNPVMVKLLPMILLSPNDIALVISVSDTSIPLVIPPFEDWIVIPDDKLSLVSRLSITRRLEGRLVLTPSDKER